MVSDERLEKIENLVCDSLNEDATLSKVNFISLVANFSNSRMIVRLVSAL